MGRHQRAKGQFVYLEKEQGQLFQGLLPLGCGRGIMAPAHQLGPVFLQLCGQLSGIHLPSAGAGQDHNVDTNELLLS